MLLHVQQPLCHVLVFASLHKDRKYQPVSSFYHQQTHNITYPSLTHLFLLFLFHLLSLPNIHRTLALNLALNLAFTLNSQRTNTLPWFVLPSNSKTPPSPLANHLLHALTMLTPKTRANPQLPHSHKRKNVPPQTLSHHLT